MLTKEEFRQIVHKEFSTLLDQYADIIYNNVYTAVEKLPDSIDKEDMSKKLCDNYMSVIKNTSNKFMEELQNGK